MDDAQRGLAYEQFPEGMEAADAFALLGNGIRMQILQALWAAPETPVAFSDLFRATDATDSAQFSYHLQQLTQHFVRRTENGYRLRQAGNKVVQAVLAGSFTAHPSRSIAISDSCVKCSGPLEAVYDDEMLAITCLRCHFEHGEYPFPPGALNNRTDPEVLEAFDHRVRRLYGLAKDGVCPECSGRMQTVVATPDDAVTCDLAGAPLRAGYVCEQCAHTLTSGVGLGLIDNSAVIAFYENHDIDLSTTPYWQLKWCVSDEPMQVQSQKPLRISITITLNDDVLEIVLDQELTVCEISQTYNSTTNVAVHDE
ncbi:DUF7351 domain-containing protein [Natronorubrum sp. FCH18a]|uniref:DUF7351 domain-containing protein n=1 Tax=Natronorubrum sp. FCH18a TaxID=3447018 RepID=UPI003F50E5F4